MDDLDTTSRKRRNGTAARPLLGMTVLAVEDSKFTCEALRQMCLRSGARIRRADCLRSARRHLKVYRPCIAIVDLGLPDGNGAELISEMAQAVPRVGAIIGISGTPAAEQTARDAGADTFLSKPIDSLAGFQAAVIAQLPRDWQPVGPRVLNEENVDPDPAAYRDDMAHVANILAQHSDGPTIDYVAQFLGGIARAARDNSLAQAADDLAQSHSAGRPITANLDRLANLVQARLEPSHAV
ncbi:response regulator [Roseovarius sp. SYSU LYC5161]|uniref:response regulator n=1 Tax=Roseovarius halophilus (ex Wu et al. 2025) TaxID=3376060 RepID=UPI00399BF28C